MSKTIIRKVISVALCAAITGGTVMAVPAISAGAVDSMIVSATVTDDETLDLVTYHEDGSTGELFLPIRLSADQAQSIIEIAKQLIKANLEGKLSEKVTDSRIYKKISEMLDNIPEEKLQKYYDAISMISGKLADAAVPGSNATVYFIMGKFGIMRVIVKCNGAMKSFIVPTDLSAENLIALNRAILYAAKTSAIAKLPDSVKQSIAVYEAKTAQLKEKIEKTVVTKADIMNSKTVDFIRKMAYLLLPENIRDNGKYAFYDFSGLEDISIDCFATKVTDYSFIGSRGFSSISIPNGVTSIGKYCFYGCSDLTEAYIPESVTSIGTGSFRSCNNDFTLYVYEGSYAEKYAKANNMKYVKLLDVKTNAPEYSYVGDTVDLQAFASGGAGDYTYCMTVYTPDGEEITLAKEESTVNDAKLTFDKAGEYSVYIEVVDAEGCTVGITRYIEVKPKLKNKTTINADTVKVGEKVVLKGAASGGFKGYKYAFYYKKSKNSDWLEMRSAYTTKSASFKPGSAVKYDIKVIAMDSNGKTAKKVFTVDVTK